MMFNESGSNRNTIKHTDIIYHDMLSMSVAALVYTPFIIGVYYYKTRSSF